ncbi:DUF6600 domain-containing protein [Acidovorax sp. SRB_14]|uniref:DUF6600 domain-containing protein n=1 Tax=Acidovorax sp. SRB_14 TaxID=1962699 RepID=UPI001566F566|nr:DUF6600 domain-containing protein [Acidovorax sp. SRB_14]
MHANAFISARGRRLALVLFVLVAAVCGTAAFAQAAGDPPGRVAQLNYFDGPVSFAPAGYEQWAGAVLNRPLTQGDRLWSDAGARSELHIGSTALRMDAQTSLALSALDDQTVQLALTQGSLIARLRSLPPDQRFEVDTPNLAFMASQPGNYRLDVDPAAGTTRVTVQAGSAVVYGSDGASVELGARQQITFAGADLDQIAGQTAPALGPLDRWAAARDLDEDRSVAARYVSREVIGYQQLDPYGDWEDDPAYGTVWVPRVAVAGWAPYRVGHWASIAPWGWTWIDDEPWGFAPFHYGRWAQRGARWCWVPGAAAVRPVYAPALVGFVGGNAGAGNFGIAVGGAVQPGVAWFPLAPGEAWRPSYRASPAYVRNVNRSGMRPHAPNSANAASGYRYQHLPAAVTAVTVAAFAQGQHVRGNARPVAAADLQRTRTVAPPAPTRDPRSVFGASRLAQPHPAPPAAVVDRRVVSPSAFQHGRGGGAPLREALPSPPRQPEPPHSAAAPARGFLSPGAAPAQPPAVPRPPLVQQEPRQRERAQPNPALREPNAPDTRAAQMQQEQQRAQAARRAQAQNEQAAREQNAQRAQAAQAAQVQQEQQRAQNARREQAQSDQAAREQNAQRVQATRAAQLQQEQQRAQAARREQAQNEQSARAAQMQAQRAQQEQQMRQAQAQHMQQQQQQMQMQMQRAEQQMRQAQSEAQRQRPPQEPRGTQVPDDRGRPGGGPQRPHREDPRPAPNN